mgnify:CR=1 FL=1
MSGRCLGEAAGVNHPGRLCSGLAFDFTHLEAQALGDENGLPGGSASEGDLQHPCDDALHQQRACAIGMHLTLHGTNIDLGIIGHACNDDAAWSHADSGCVVQSAVRGECGGRWKGGHSMSDVLSVQLGTGYGIKQRRQRGAQLLIDDHLAGDEQLIRRMNLARAGFGGPLRDCDLNHAALGQRDLKSPQPEVSRCWRGGFRGSGAHATVGVSNLGLTDLKCRQWVSMDYTPAFISATVSLAIFTATQLWTFKKSQHDFLKQRLEEAVNGYRAALCEMKTLHEHPDLVKDAKSAYFGLYAALNKPDLLITLYFPDLNALRESIFNAANGVLSYYKAVMETGRLPPKELGSIHVKAMSNGVDELREVVLADYNQLTRNPARFW